MDEENVSPEEAEAWLNEQGFHGGHTTIDDPPHFRDFLWGINGTRKAVGGTKSTPWGKFLYKAYFRGYWNSPQFGTPWAAVAYADLCAWGRGAPTVSGTLRVKLTDQSYIDTGVWVDIWPHEPAMPELEWHYPDARIQEAIVGTTLFPLRSFHVSAGDRVRLNLSIGYS